jgi:predicted dehydrogenase
MTDYDAAIIGVGRMSRGHGRAYQELGIPIIAVADISQKALDSACEGYGIAKEHAYLDYAQMLDEVKPNLVSVVTAEALHCEMVVAAAERGVKGIVCEKPMAMDLGEAQRMLDACRASGTKLTVSHQRYYSPQYARARQLVAEGAIGKVRFAEAFAMAESIHTDGTHTIHMLLSLLGDPKISYLLAAIDGNSDYRYYGHRCDHGGNAFLAFENQAYAHLTWGLHTYDPKARLHPLWDFSRYRYHAFVVHGEEGRLEIDGDIYYRGEVTDPPAIMRIVRGAEVENVAFEWPPAKGAIALEVEDLIRTIETGVWHPLCGENGYAVTEVIMGIYASSQCRGVVHFPVEMMDNAFQSMVREGIFSQSDSHRSDTTAHT